MKRVFKMHQRGVVFIISVIMLLVLAGLSLTILSTSVSEKVQSGQTQDMSLAKLSANNAIAFAKQDLLDQWWLGQTECTSVPCTCGDICVWTSTTFDGINLTQQDGSWWADYGTEVPQPNVEEQPRYIIIDQGCDSIAMASRYRIVARGVGATAESVAYSDDSFSVPVNANNLGDGSTESTYYAIVDGFNVDSFNLSPSQVSSSFFVDNTGSLCPSGHASFAQCEVNCTGAVRVMAYSYDNNCGPIYGSWSYSGEQSDISRITVNGIVHSVSCSL